MRVSDPLPSVSCLPSHLAPLLLPFGTLPLLCRLLGLVEGGGGCTKAMLVSRCHVQHHQTEMSAGGYSKHKSLVLINKECALGCLCRGNGACLTLAEAALLSYGENKDLLGVTYSTPWDAKLSSALFNLPTSFYVLHFPTRTLILICSKIRGCVCYRSWTTDDQYAAINTPPGALARTLYQNYNRTKFYR
jgi:hypothetical protein